MAKNISENTHMDAQETRRLIRHASILIETPTGDLLFHHRDNKPGIANPDHIGMFGGGVEDGETYQQAAVRELREELGLSLNEYDLIPFTIIERGKENVFTHIEVFLVKGINPINLKLNPNEGQGIAVISKNDDWRSKKLTQTARELLELYFKKHR